MSAEVEVFMGREQAWHRLGVVKGRAFGLDDIRAEAPELLMDVRLAPTYIYQDDSGKVIPHGKYIETPRTCAVVRADGKIVGEGVGKDSYGIVQPLDAFEWGEAISNRTGYPLVSAGTLREGRQFFFTYDAGSTEPGGLRVDNHLTVCSSHDGSLALMALHSSTIVVCANTLAAARASATDRTVIKHTALVEDRLAAEIHAIQTQKAHQSLIANELELLLAINVNEDTREALLESLIPAEQDNAQAATRARKAKSKIRGLILGSSVTAGFEDTGLGFVQGVNTYENWDKPIRGERAERQFDAMVKGRQPLTDKAIERTLALA